MTTIAFKDGILAADRRAMTGGGVSGTAEKFMRVAVGNERVVVAVTGDLATLPRVERWLDLQDDWYALPDDGPLPPAPCAPELEEGSVAILAYRSGIVEFLEGKSGHTIRITAPFHARGSGREYALGAMAHGASAIEAVRIAMRFDPYTGDGVEWINVETGEMGLVE